MSVIIFHLSPKSFSGGFIGVDIFFVISGFLITTIILSSQERGNFSLAEFYARRIRRILPALLTVIATTLAIGWFVLLVDEFSLLGKHTASAALFLSNFTLYLESGYFDTDAYSKPFLHLWSLAVEEQFYLLWPLLLIFAGKRQWPFLRFAGAIALTSFLINLFLCRSDATAAFYFPFSRFWELMAGGALAYIAIHRASLLERGSQARALAGLALLVAGLLLIDQQRAFPGWWALLPTLGTALLISAGSHAPLNAQLLSHRYLLRIGLISYPLYLWHWPLLSLAKTIGMGKLNDLAKAAVVILSFVLAWLTYRYIEKPFRLGLVRHGVKKLCGGLVLALLLGGVIYQGYIMPRNDNPATQLIVHALKDIEFPDGLTPFEFHDKTFHSIQGARADMTVFIGDSHVRHYSPRVVHLLRGDSGRPFNSTYFLTEPGCPALPEYAEDMPQRERCLSFMQAAMEFIRHPQVRKVVIGGCWNCILKESSPRENSHEAQLTALQHMLGALAANHREVYLLLDTPSDKSFHPLKFLGGSRLTELTADTSRVKVKLTPSEMALNRKMHQIAARAGVKVLDPVSGFCDAELNCPLIVQGKPVYRDGDHLRPFFVRERAGFIDQAL